MSNGIGGALADFQIRGALIHLASTLVQQCLAVGRCGED